MVGLLRERRPGAQVLPEPVEGAVVLVAQRACGGTEVRQVAGLEKRVARVRGEAAEEVGAQHRRHHRAVAAARLPGDPAVPGVGARAVARVHPGDDLVAEVSVVAARARRVEKLAAAERSPGVDPNQHRRRRLARGEELVHQLRRVLAERRAVAPHVELARQALDQVDRRVAALALVVVAGRHVDPERPHVRVAEDVPSQGLALESVFFEAAGNVCGPGQHQGKLAADSPRRRGRGIRRRGRQRWLI